MFENKKFKIAIVGAGYVGGNLYDALKKEAWLSTSKIAEDIIQYSLEPEFIKNKDRVQEADIVFICVNTPTDVLGQDISAVEETIGLCRQGAIVVLKSTITIDNLDCIYAKFHGMRTILYCPEFLTAATARQDTMNPKRNIIGVVNNSMLADILAAKTVMEILPAADYALICTYREASLIKFARNNFFYVKNMFFNMIYSLCESYGASYETIRKALISDGVITEPHTITPHGGGRGASNKCLLKDMAAFRISIETNDNVLYEDEEEKELVLNLLKANEEYNKYLLTKTKKDLDLLNGVYSKSFRTINKKTKK